jgi:hypothetical protein
VVPKALLIAGLGEPGTNALNVSEGFEKEPREGISAGLEVLGVATGAGVGLVPVAAALEFINSSKSFLCDSRSVPKLDDVVGVDVLDDVLDDVTGFDVLDDVVGFDVLDDVVGVDVLDDVLDDVVGFDVVDDVLDDVVGFDVVDDVLDDVTGFDVLNDVLDDVVGFDVVDLLANSAAFLAFSLSIRAKYSLRATAAVSPDMLF